MFHKKRYLTGIDWTINVLDSITRKVSGHGNSSQVVLCLNSPPDIERLKRLLMDSFQHFPLLRGSIKRAWNLCPYWRPGERGSFFEPPLTVHEKPESDFAEALSLLVQQLQKPFANTGAHLHFNVIKYRDNQTLLGMHFDHRVLDAYGAELLLDILGRGMTPADLTQNNLPDLTEPSHLNRWPRRFIAGREINRLQVSLSKPAVASLPAPPKSELPVSTRIELLTFPPDIGRAIRLQAEKESGPLMLIPALLARVLQPLHSIFSQRGEARGNYVIPVSINQRLPHESWRKLFFNHLSFIFFCLTAEELEGDADITEKIRQQLYEQMKRRIPENIYHASMLTRIAPLALMRRLAKIPLGGKVATCYFACLKESGLGCRQFLGSQVNNLFHTPHVPIPPGLGVFLNFFDGKLNLTLSHAAGILSEDEVSLLKNELYSRLEKMGNNP